MEPVTTTLLIVGGISALIGGISKMIEKGELSEQQAAQAAQLQTNITNLEAELKAGRLDIEAAIAQIDTMIANTSGKLRTVMEAQVDLAADQIQAQLSEALAAQERQLEKYRGTLTREQEEARKTLQKQAAVARETIRRTMVQRRMPHKVAGKKIEEEHGRIVERMEKELGRKLTEAEDAAAFQRAGMTAEAGRQAARVRAAGLADITRTMAGLEQAGLGMKLGLGAERRGLQLSGMQQLMQLRNMATALEAAAETSGLGYFGAFLKGAAPGLGQITGAMMYGGEGVPGAPAAAGIPEGPTPVSFAELGKRGTEIRKAKAERYPWLYRS